MEASSSSWSFLLSPRMLFIGLVWLKKVYFCMAFLRSFVVRVLRIFNLLRSAYGSFPFLFDFDKSLKRLGLPTREFSWSCGEKVPDLSNVVLACLKLMGFILGLTRASSLSMGPTVIFCSPMAVPMTTGIWESIFEFLLADIVGGNLMLKWLVVLRSGPEFTVIPVFESSPESSWECDEGTSILFQLLVIWIFFVFYRL